MSDTVRWLSDEEQALWRLLLDTTRKVDRCLDETLQQGQGLSMAEFGVLVSLSEAEGGSLRLRDLCRSLEWDRSRTSHQVSRMQRRGLVSKNRDAGDARGVLVSITDDGWRRIKSAAPEHVESVRRLVFDNFRDGEHELLANIARRVIAVDNVPGTPGFTGTLGERDDQGQ